MQYIKKCQDRAYDNMKASWQSHMYRKQAGKDWSQLWRQTVSNWGRSVCLPSRRLDKHEAIETRTDTERHSGREIQSKTTYKLKKKRNIGTKKEGTTTRQLIWLTSCSTPAVPPQFVRRKVRSDRAPLLATTVCSTTSVSTPAIREWYTAVASCSAKTTFS